MRIANAVVIVAALATSPAFAQSNERYGGAPSAGDSSSRFSELFSTESDRSRSAPPATTRPSSAARDQRGSSLEIKPLTPPRSTPRQPIGSTPSRAATSQPGPPKTNRSLGGRAGRYNGDPSGTPPASAYGARTLESPRQPVERSIAVGGRREAAAHAILADMLRPPANSKLSGTPTRLSDAVSRAGSREQQSRVIESYWALSSAVMDYYLGLTEAVELGRLRREVPTYSTALSEALVGINGRVDTSLQAARAAQLRLGKQMGGGARPLPIDVPFCGPYATRFGQNFPGGGSEEARLLNDLLPARLAELQATADAVERSMQWLSKVQAARAGGDGAGLIRALELLALNRRAFVMLARDYNLQINRYTQLTAPGDRVDTNRLVAMLIRTGGGSSSVVANGSPLEFRSGAASRR